MSTIDKTKMQELDVSILIFSNSYLDFIEKQTDDEIKDTLTHTLQSFANAFRLVKEINGSNKLVQMTKLPKIFAAMNTLKKYNAQLNLLQSQHPNRFVALSEFIGLCDSQNEKMQQLIKSLAPN